MRPQDRWRRLSPDVGGKDLASPAGPMRRVRSGLTILLRVALLCVFLFFAFSYLFGRRQPQAPCHCPDCDVPATVLPRFYNSCELVAVGGRRSDGYGSWPLCRNQLPPGGIIYSVGIGKDASFDYKLALKGFKVYGFDPTVDKEGTLALGGKAQKWKDNFVFTQLGLGAENAVVKFLHPKHLKAGSKSAAQPDRFYGDAGFTAPVVTLHTLMAIMKHDHIDMLKMDIEGLEYDLCSSQDFLDLLPRVGQLGIEFHERFFKNKAMKVDLLCTKAFEVAGFKHVARTESKENLFARLHEHGIVVPGGNWN